MTLTKLTNHNDCKVTVEQTPKGHYHPAQLMCLDHNIHIQWLSIQQAEEISLLLNLPQIEWNDLNSLNDRERGRSLPPTLSLRPDNWNHWNERGLFEVAK